MKKALCVIAALLAAASASSCSARDMRATDILYEIIAHIEEPPAYNLYFSEADMNADEYVSAEKLSGLYGGSDPAGQYLSFALLLSEDDSIYEIHVFRAVSEAKAIQIEKILCRRQDMLQKRDVYMYDEDNYERVISQAQVFRKGSYCFLLLTADNRTVKSVIEKMI